MVKVTNNTDRPQVFHVKPGKKGEPPMVHDLRPGESADLDLYDRSSGTNTGREAVGAITIHDDRAPKPSAHVKPKHEASQK